MVTFIETVCLMGYSGAKMARSLNPLGLSGPTDAPWLSHVFSAPILPRHGGIYSLSLTTTVHGYSLLST